MSKPPYPLADAEFIVKKLLESSKIETKTYLKVGNTHTFNLKGNKPLHKKLIVIREMDGSINFMQATGLAALHGFMGELLDWYEKEKHWKEGAYIKKPK
ncbi:hypothetical protein [Maribacter sp. IgM3_T14_3]|uniref:hypothetical protein n=1 Tax=Maribacter sp. IgM3_T14_3 TaxID=3415140 RepID=UPI003C6F2AE5